MNNTKERSNKLNELIEKNMNAKDSYEKAIEKVDSADIKNFFKSRAEERARFVKELRSEVWENKDIPENSGNIKGELHQNWMSLKSLFSSNDEEAMLQETVRIEKTSLKEYNEVISGHAMPSPLINTLKNQKSAIETAIRSAENFENIVS
ncbi:ferritin-like domain-containing protein [Winogradskyella algicola]|uniref:ferritin-like domain-containing protein n=1 Tax=Winogradskyella algicola TaxID=2575815 RepID=UPI00110957DB|nr:PA2169 family four-helix-bundle protein [Winogradskyella algicola]